MSTVHHGRTGRLVRGGVGILAFLVLAEAAVRLKLISADIPAPTKVGEGLGDLLTRGEFWDEIGVTLKCWFGGVGIAILIAVPLGLLLGSLPGLNTASRALIEFLRPIPSVAIIPAVVIILGLGIETRLFVIAYAAAWPILFNTIYGLGEVDPLAKETARSFGFGRLAVLLRIALTSAAPFILTGIRLAVSTGLVVEVSLELVIGGEGGIGAYISSVQSGGEARLDLVLAIVTVAGLLGLFANSVLEAIGRRTFSWSSLAATR